MRRKKPTLHSRFFWTCALCEAFVLVLESLFQFAAAILLCRFRHIPRLRLAGFAYAPASKPGFVPQNVGSVKTTQDSLQRNSVTL